MSAPEFFFYHLEAQPLHGALPLLLEKTLERGWRACVRFTTAERLDMIDSALWTYRDDAFLPHGTARDGHSERQPVYLTLGSETPNGAEVVFLTELAEEPGPDHFRRVVRLFDDTDEEARGKARAEWQAAKARGSPVSYWRRKANGAWTKAG